MDLANWKPISQEYSPERPIAQTHMMENIMKEENREIQGMIESSDSNRIEAPFNHRESENAQTTAAVSASPPKEPNEPQEEEAMELSYSPGKTVNLCTVVGKEKIYGFIATPDTFTSKKAEAENARSSRRPSTPTEKQERKLNDVSSIISSPTTGLAIFINKKKVQSAGAPATSSPAVPVKSPSMSLVSHIEEVPSLSNNSPNPTSNTQTSNVTSSVVCKSPHANSSLPKNSTGQAIPPKKRFPLVPAIEDTRSQPVVISATEVSLVMPPKEVIPVSDDKIKNDSLETNVNSEAPVTYINNSTSSEIPLEAQGANIIENAEAIVENGLLKTKEVTKIAEINQPTSSMEIEKAETSEKQFFAVNINVEEAKEVRESEETKATEENEPKDENILKRKKPKEEQSLFAIKKSKRKVEEPQGAKRSLSASSTNTTSQEEVAVSYFARHTNPTEQSLFGALTNNPLLQNLNNNVVSGNLFTVAANNPSKEVSFLESMSEDERRTRNRHIPNVKGFRRLHRHEMKRDMKAIRSQDPLPWFLSMHQNEGEDETAELAADLAAAADGMHGADDVASVATSMDVEEEASTMSGGPIAESAALTQDAAAHLAPFVVPTHYDSLKKARNAQNQLDDDAEVGDEKSGRSKKIKIRFPDQVESVVAFDPPRDDVILQGRSAYTQSKKQRMAYWEQNPREIEVSLEKFQATVRKTRWEWQNASLERERVEEVGATLRHHLLQQAKTLREESILVSQQAAKYQRQCVLEAELMASRTRSRGSHSHSMRDVMSVLRSRGEKINYFPSESTKSLHSAFECAVDLQADRGKGKPKTFVHGDPVSTLYGAGVVQNLLESTIIYPDRSKPGNSESLVVIPSRLLIRLPFGMAYMTLGQVQPLLTEVRIASFSDCMLVSRWKQLLDAAKDSELLDGANEMDHIPSREGYEQPPNDAAPFDVELLKALAAAHENSKISTSSIMSSSTEPAVPQAKHNSHTNVSFKMNAQEARRRRAIPFQGGLLPSTGGRACILAKGELNQIQDELDRVTHENGASRVLGRENNPAVPEEIKSWEQERHKLYQLKATALRLRNRLLQQKRARLTNERAYATVEERSDRVHTILTEMKADLKSLKKRLSDELHELGIPQDRARQILADHLSDQDGWGEENSRNMNHNPSRTKRKLHEPNSSLHGVDINAAIRTSRRKAQEAMRSINDESNSMCDGQDNDNMSLTSASRRAKRARLEEDMSDFAADRPKTKRLNRRQ